MIFDKNKLFQKSMMVLGLRIGGVILLFGLTLFLTNNFNAELVGKYDFVRSSIMILGGITLLGTNQSIIYYSGFLKSTNNRGALRNIYFKMLIIVVATSCLFLLTFSILPDHYFNSFFNKPDAADLIKKVIITLSVFAVTMLNIDMIRALNNTLISEFFRNIMRYLPFFVIAVILVFNGSREFLVNGYLWSFVLLALLSSAVVFTILKKQKEPDALKLFNYREILSKSYPMAISALSYFLMQSIDILLLSKYDTFQTVAHYAVAVKLATIIALALASVNVIAAPRIAELYSSGNRKELKDLVSKSSRIILAISLPSLIVLAIFANPILGMFGNDYKIAFVPLLILLGGQLVNSLCGPVAIYLNMTERQSLLQSILVFGLLLNLLLNLILIPRYGMSGAALGTSISIVVWNISATAYVYIKDNVKTFLS